MWGIYGSAGNGVNMLTNCLLKTRKATTGRMRFVFYVCFGKPYETKERDEN